MRDHVSHLKMCASYLRANREQLKRLKEKNDIIRFVL